MANTPVRRIAVSDLIRGAIIERYGRICQYCGASSDSILKGPGDKPWHIDHIKPVAKGGTNHENNLTLSCARCNVHKLVEEGIIDAKTGRVRRKARPVYFPMANQGRWLLPLDVAVVLGIGRQTVMNSMMRGVLAHTMCRDAWGRSYPRIYVWSVRRAIKIAADPPAMLDRLDAFVAKRWGDAA